MIHSVTVRRQYRKALQECQSLTIRRCVVKDSTKLLTVQEAEALTGRKVATWRKDILCRRIPYVKIGRQVRIPLEAIEDLIRKGYRPSVPEPGMP
jgi:excisionase family DNA binding protein